MASSIHKRVRSGKTDYRAFYRVPGADGIFLQKTKSFATRKAAAAFLARKAVEMEDGYSDPSERSVAAFLADWIGHLEVRNQLSPATLNHYRRQAATLSSMLGAKKLVKLMPGDLTHVYDMLITGTRPATKRLDGLPKRVKPWSIATVRAFHGFVRTAFEVARKARLIRANPANDAIVPKPDDNRLDGAEGVRAFSDEEIERMFAAASDDIFPGLDAIMMVLMVCGCRRGELLGLAWPHVHFDDNRIDIRQTVIAGQKGEPILRTRLKTKNARRSIDVPAALMDRLRRHKAWQAEHAMRWGGEYCRKLELVFPNWNGEPPAPSRFTYALGRLMKVARIERAQPAHGWRHSMPIRLLADGHDIVTVSRRMGHSKPSMTLNRYGHSTREKDREAGETMGRNLSRIGVFKP